MNDTDQEKECTYKNERYAVRDNGAVLRYPRDNLRIRTSDNQWTFGKQNDKTGYMEIAGERVHRIVATAFLGEPPTKEHVVDHIDTNKQNNRVDNLRWVTRLENVLLNPITAKRIELVCGSVEAFLENPSKFRDKFQEPNYAWMCTVSASEAKTSLERLLQWAASDKRPSVGLIGEWIYKTRSNIQFVAPIKQEEQVVTKNETVATLDLNQSSQRIRHKYYDMPKYPEEFSDYATSDAVRLKTKGEILGSIQSILKSNLSIMLPNLELPTCGGNILIEKANLKEFKDVDFIFEGKVRTPQHIIFEKDNYRLAVVFRIKGYTSTDRVEWFKANGVDVLEVDLTWAKEGLSEEELIKVLNINSSKKKWLFSKLIDAVAEKLINVCEPIQWSGQGVLHSYVANCPLMTEPYNGRNGVQDIECWYCDYRYGNDEKGGCFGKAKIETYDDLLSVVEVRKKDEQIIGITFSKNGEVSEKEFVFYDEETSALGKTLLELWDEKTSDKLIARNVINGWCVLIEENPRVAFTSKGSVYARLSKNIEDLPRSMTRSIWGFDSKEWEEIK